MDEFGSRIQNSDNPSVAMSVFFYIPLQMAFSLIWPLRDLDCEGGVCVYMCVVCVCACVYMCVYVCTCVYMCVHVCL